MILVTISMSNNSKAMNLAKNKEKEIFYILI